MEWLHFSRLHPFFYFSPLPSIPLPPELVIFSHIAVTFTLGVTHGSRDQDEIVVSNVLVTLRS